MEEKESTQKEDREYIKRHLMVEVPESKPAIDIRCKENSMSGFGTLSDHLLEDVK